MNYSHFRIFAYGIILATIIFTAIYYFPNNEKVSEVPSITEHDVNAYLSENKLTAITIKEFEQFKLAKSKLLELEKQMQKHKEEASNKKELPQVLAYQLKVKNGMNSEDIARELEKAKIIKNAAEFIKYLSDNGYHRHIQIGEFHITNDMSYQEIAVIITKGRK